MSLEVRLRLSHRDPEDVVEATFTAPGVLEGVSIPELSVEAVFALDRQALAATFVADESLHQYGDLLSSALFNEKIRDLFLESWGVIAQRRQNLPHSSDDVLRVRIRYDPAWNNLAWETLSNPRNGAPLISLDQNVTLTREVPAKSWGSLVVADFKKALIVVANPRFGPAAQLPPIDPAYAAAARNSLEASGLTVKELVAPDQTTWEQISSTIDEAFDVWYLVCHGAVDQSRGWIFLTHPDGSVHQIDVAQVEERVDALRKKPSLVILLSCHSATGVKSLGTPGSQLAWALGPRLVRTGIPAVIAMQGAISQETAIDFATSTLSALRRLGDVERAVATGRQHAKARGHLDWWSPCLFSLAGAAPLVIRPDKKFNNWGPVTRWIKTEQCIPILGFGVGESLFGPVRRLVQRVAKNSGYPGWDQAPVDLPTVAQYMATIIKDDDFPKESFLAQVCEEIVYNHLEMLDDEFRAELAAKPPDSQSVTELHATIRRIAQKVRADPDDPYRIIASLPCKYFITTMPDDLLEDALLEQTQQVGASRYPRHPFSQACQWLDQRMSLPQEERNARHLREISEVYNSRTGKPSSTQETDLEKLISLDRPNVYHLFGQLDPISSWVLTEDNYLDFLSSVSRENPMLIPTHLNSAITRSALLFLGFEINQWSFRIILQIIQKAIRSGNKANVAVQLDVNGQSVAVQLAAMEYLAKRFEQFARINIYWGTAQQFLAELRSKL
jgi:hypothetical protein